MGAPNARGRIEKEWTRAKGLAFGSGLLDNVADAYRYLMNKFEKNDRIFLFGFSRGAYTARAIASLLHVFGLLEGGNEGLIPYILRLYAKRTKETKRSAPTFTTEDNFKYAFSREVDVHFCGLWDTVSSYGWITSPIDLPFAGQNPIIRASRHAISIHEHRCCFQANLWGSALPDQDIRQVWFSGFHSDVGARLPTARAASDSAERTGVWRCGKQNPFPTSPHPRRRLRTNCKRGVTLTFHLVQKIGQVNPA